MNPAIAAALMASLTVKPKEIEPSDSVLPVLTGTHPADSAIVVGAAFSMQVMVSNLADLTGAVDYIWYETTSGSPVEVESHRGQSTWISSATTTSGTRTFYAEVTHTEAGKTTATATSRTATVTISEA